MLKDYKYDYSTLPRITNVIILRVAASHVNPRPIKGSHDPSKVWRTMNVILQPFEVFRLWSFVVFKGCMWSFEGLKDSSKGCRNVLISQRITFLFNHLWFVEDLKHCAYSLARILDTWSSVGTKDCTHSFYPSNDYFVILRRVLGLHIVIGHMGPFKGL